MAVTTEALEGQAAAVSAAGMVAPYLEDFDVFACTLPAGEPAAVKAVRRRALERFAALGFPTTRQEDWRFTNVAPIARTAFHRKAGEPAAPESATEVRTFPALARLTFVDGRFAPGLSEIGELPEGVVVASLADALALTPEAVEPHLAQYASFEAQPFVALNTAFWADGAFVSLPPGAVVREPIHLVFLSSGTAELPTIAYPRNLFLAGAHSQGTIVETYQGTGAYFNCAVTEVVAGPDSVLDHYKVQRESTDAYHLSTFEVRGERGSHFSSHSISLGGALVRNDVNAVLAGEGIDAILNGLYLAEGRQHVDHHMRVEHAAPHCSSHELFKGILDGKARAVFNGLIHVHPGAQKTDAKQSNRNLLLSKEAIANSNPQLEIFADDVKCTHGSTVGQLDDDAVFYLRSRGIGVEAARSLLTYAFASDLVERIKVDPVRHELTEFLFARLPQGEVVRQAV